MGFNIGYIVTLEFSKKGQSMSVPVNLSQPSLALAQSVVTRGTYPNYYGSNPMNDGSTMGMVITTAYSPTSPNLAPANGGIYSYDSNQAMAAIIGNIYGGTTGQSYALPDLTGKVIVSPGSAPWIYGSSANNPFGNSLGAVQGNPGNIVNLSQEQLPDSLGGSMLPISTAQYGQALNYVIQIEGLYPQGSDTVSTLGNIYPFLGTQAPAGFAFCDGRSLQVSQYAALYTLIGDTYSSEFNPQSFNIPNLMGTVPVGVGGQYYWPGENGGYVSTNISPWNIGPGNLGTLQTSQPSLSLNYIISTVGTSEPISDLPMLGQVTLYAGSRPADGWVVCNGQMLQISQYNDLYQLIGTTYGGDGVLTFAVPDLRGRTVVGSGTGLPIGTVSGNSSIALTSANYPTIVVPIPGVSLGNDTGSSGSDLVTSNPNLTLSSIWPDATVQYSDDGISWSTSFKPIEGLNTFYVRQIDVIGQPSQAAHPITFTLDTKAPVSPTVNIEYGFGNLVVGPGGSGITSLSGNLALSNIERGAKINYSTDGGKTWSDHFQAVFGNNNVQVRQVDLAGNVSTPSAPILFQMLSDPSQKANIQLNPLPTGGQEIVMRAPGLVGDDVGSVYVDTIRHNLQSSLTLPKLVENIVLTGLGGGNVITANGEANRFDVQTGSWIVRGANAKDTVIFSDNIAQYRISQGSDPKVIVDGAATNVSAVIETVSAAAANALTADLPKLQFKDASLLFTNSASAKGLFGLYTGLLERSPDFTGQVAWQRALDQGLSLSKVADEILNSNEYTGRYGTKVSTKDFVLDLYDNALHRTADSKGLSAWINAIDSHTMTKGEVVVAITGSVEANANQPMFVLQIA